MIIRQAEKDDISKVLLLQKQWCEEGITHGYNPSNPDDLERQTGCYFLVADCQGELTGFVLASEHASEGTAVFPEGVRFLEIEDIYVVPELRNHGVGSALLEKVMTVAREHGIERFSLYSATIDLDSILRFYGCHGFKSWFVRMYI